MLLFVFNISTVERNNSSLHLTVTDIAIHKRMYIITEITEKVQYLLW